MANTNLKKKLIQSGLKKQECENCYLTSWLNKEIPLEVHHIDGNSENNKYDNLQLLCPNCHSLTDNFRGRNIKRVSKIFITDEALEKAILNSASISEALRSIGLVTEGANYKRVKSLMASKNIALKQKVLTEAQIDSKLRSRKTNRPSKEELAKLVWKKPTSQLAKDFNVSDKAITKWCIFYGINKPKRGYWQKLKTNNLL